MSTKVNIKCIALKLFAEKGYEGTSIESIASQVGIKKASVYSHIKSKEELYISILKDVLRWDRNYFSELLESNMDIDEKEKLYLIFKHYSKIYQEEPNRTKMMFLNRAMLFPPDFIKEELKQIFNDYEALYSPILIEIIKSGIASKLIKDIQLDDILAFFYCTVDGLFVESYYYSIEEYSKRINSIWLLFWLAIKL